MRPEFCTKFLTANGQTSKQVKGPCAANFGSSTPAQQQSNKKAHKMWGRGGDIAQAMIV
jgi:hypothetical protein